MPPVVIENPVLNSPFREPARHFRFDDDGITDEILDGRRSSSYFVPIARPRGRSGQLRFDTEWTADRVEENAHVNRIRARVAIWRQGGWAGVTNTTRRLLEHWTAADREKRLFFCQVEALETLIYLNEVAKKYDAWIETDLRQANDTCNPGMPRIACKMATGTGKTVVMGMIIAWHALNKLANPQDARFSDTFLIVTPGITIRDRLRVILPGDPESYYRQRDLVPPDFAEKLQQARILITNYHAFTLRERGDASRLTKTLLAGGQPTSAFTETPDQMVRRALRELGNKKNIVVLNDEAHHCYRRKPDGEAEKLDRDERQEAKRRDEAARVWLSGLEAIKSKIGIKVVYDLSATPFFLKGSGWPEGTLFPWVVSDFSLIDAIESGVVKVPRVPVEDNANPGASPTYRDLWLRIRDDLPKKGRSQEDLAGREPKLPKELEGALFSLYRNYEAAFRSWESSHDAAARGATPPVFIVVCNNTATSKLVFDWISGWEKVLVDEGGNQAYCEPIVVPGRLPLFSNEEAGRWTIRPNTILIDSEQLDSGDGMSADFKQAVAHEIDEWKQQWKLRTGRDPEDLTDEDLLREVMNTVGKAGKLGEGVRCVVSVSMLTEGWDANTVTHVLGIRAFGTQLLCEQVVGRALRRTSYPAELDVFEPEYAEVYGVPFSFIPTSGSTKEAKPGPVPTRVRALESRIACEITFPRLVGYRHDIESERLEARFSTESCLAISTRDVPTRTESMPIVGTGSTHTLDELRTKRLNEVAFKVATLVLTKHFAGKDGVEPRHWLFPQVLRIAQRWLAECLTCKDDTFPQMLLLAELAHEAADRVGRSIQSTDGAKMTLLPILRPYDVLGSTRAVDFDTTKPTWPTGEDMCHVSHVVADTQSWEQKAAQSLEDMDEVHAYVKNQGLGFTIPYTHEGNERQYLPDFIARIDDGHGEADLLNLVIEVTGEKKRDKEAKVATARTLWIPAVNNHGGFGRWAFLEIADPWETKSVVRAALRRAVPAEGEHV